MGHSTHYSTSYCIATATNTFAVGLLLLLLVLVLVLLLLLLVVVVDMMVVATVSNGYVSTSKLIFIFSSF